ncbi:hypothetical protein [Aquimarina megaterium]|uniref:hypothetical protein n=1 Tax=Aquimarina megaterium TaxID=1443666 RepID=UPI00046F200B|nr:hypothetical protein [Aquimarina megaterium]
MSLLRFEGIYFIEYNDQSAGIITRLFRFYPAELEVRSMFVLGGDINKQISIGMAKTITRLESKKPGPEINIGKYQLNENYQIKFTLGTESFIGNLSLDHVYIDFLLNNDIKGSLFKFDLIRYIRFKEVGELYVFE